jgi:tripartite-type tricarboxylate transporter receptor subunit TctC
MTSVARMSLVLLALAVSHGAALAQSNYPNRPIRFIASQGAGGLSDTWIRAVADALGPMLGGSVVVEGRPGAAGNIGARACADSPPDGYTFCILPGETITINPHVMKDTGFDPKKSLAPVSKVFVLTQVFAVNADLGVKNFEELAALAKAKPKTLVYMAPSISKVAFMQEFNKKHGVDFVRVPFKGGGDAINAMMTGTAPIAIFGIGNLRSLMQSGKVLGFAVDSEQRWPLAPDIPTFREIGYKDHIIPSSFGVYAPAGTPKEIIARVNQGIVKIASNPEFQKKHMIPRGLAAVLNSPEQFEKELESDRAEGLAAIKASGLYADVR